MKVAAATLRSCRAAEQADDSASDLEATAWARGRERLVALSGPLGLPVEGDERLEAEERKRGEERRHRWGRRAGGVPRVTASGR